MPEPDPTNARPETVKRLRPSPLSLDVLGNLQGIINLNAKIAHCAFQLGMSKQ